MNKYFTIVILLVTVISCTKTEFTGEYFAPKFPKEKTVNISSIGVELVLDSPNSIRRIYIPLWR